MIDKCTFGKEVYPVMYITQLKELKKLMPRLMELDSLIGLDTETFAKKEYKLYERAALFPQLSNIRLIQIFTGRTSIIIDCLKCGLEQTADQMREFLSTKKFVAHNAAFELSYFKSAPYNIRHMNCGCTMILSRLIFQAVSHENIRANLKAIVWLLFKIDLGKEVGASDWGMPDLNFEQLDYAAIDPIATYKIAEYFAPKLNSLGMTRLYKLLKAAQHPIVEMQLQGMHLDTKKHLETIYYWRDGLIQARKEVQELTKLPDITAFKMAEWLEENLEKSVLQIWPRTEKGKLQTDAHAFADFSYLPIVEPFSRYQKLDKLTSSFGRSLIENLNPETGKIHCKFNLTGTRTGRLSCSDPNMQQLPRSPDKKKNPNEPDIRANLIAPPGKVFVCADYSQLELRVAAEVSQDKNMLKAYKDGIDLHALTAANIAKKKLENVSKSERQMAKAVNFGLLFGLGAAKFSHYARKSYGVEITQEQAFEAIDTFRTLYSGYFEWQMNQAAFAEHGLKVSTPCGKIRKLDPDNTYGPSMNTPIQGGAAEVGLHAMCRIDQNRAEDWSVVLFVHDEIIIAVPEEDAKDGQEFLEECMVSGFLDVFPKGITRGLVESKIGKTWAEAK